MASSIRLFSAIKQNRAIYCCGTKAFSINHFQTQNVKPFQQGR